MERNENEPAFPRLHAIQDPDSIGWDRPRYSKTLTTGGLTKRELIAAMAMQGQLSSGIPGEHYRVRDCALLSVQFADALLAALATSANLKEPQQ